MVSPWKRAGAVAAALAWIAGMAGPPVRAAHDRWPPQWADYVLSLPAERTPAGALPSEAPSGGARLPSAAPLHGSPGAAIGAIFGLGLDRSGAPATLRATGRLELAAPPERFAADYLAGAGLQLAGPRGGFEALDDRRAGTLRHILYHQTHDGLPVLGTRIQFTFGGHALLHVNARLADGIDLPDTRARQASAAARQAALAGLPPARETHWTTEELAILPRSLSGLAEDRLVWRLRCVSPDRLSAWQMLVDAHCGTLLERRPLVSTAAMTRVAGRVEADLIHPSPWGAEIRVPLAHMTVRALDAEQIVAAGTTRADGSFDLGDPGIDDLTLEYSLAGPYASVHDGELDRPSPRWAVEHPGLPAAFTWNRTHASEAARGAFHHINRAHARLKQIDPGFDALDRIVPALVNDSTASCNAMAYLIPEAPFLRFLIGGSLCANAGEIADVIYHEYAHLITMYAYLPEDGPPDFHESFSDYFAASLVDTCLVGRDFFGEGSHLRSLSNEMTWPVTDPRCAGDPHCVGMILGGALWDIRAGLIDAYGDRQTGVAAADRLYHFMRAGRPFDYQDCLIQLLLVDDDDGDLANGTPHLALIAEAFERRNLGIHEVQFVHLPPPDTESTGTPIELELRVSAIHPLRQGSVQIGYRTNGGRYVIEPLDEAAPYLYRYAIPGQPEGTHVDYYFMAADEAGHAGRWPAADGDTFTFFVGRDEIPPVIAHREIAQLTRDQTHLWLTATATDNSGRLAGVHGRVTLLRPGGPETIERALLPKHPEHAPDLYEIAVALGDGLTDATEVRYQLWAQDASVRQNRSYYPSAGAEATAAVVRGQTWDIDLRRDGLVAGGDWQFGPPDLATGAPVPVSGNELAATRLAGDHGEDLLSYLELPAVDLSSWEAGLLSFDSWYWTEAQYDGGWVEINTQGADEWIALVPPGGYPGAIRWGGSWRACFHGRGDRWDTVQIPLDRFLGEPEVRFRFAFYSDALVTELGWYLDDIRVLETQLLAPPPILYASQGEDGQVSLRWTKPEGIDTARPGFLGYNLYRGRMPGDPGSEPINSAPHAELHWIDSDVVNGERYGYAVTAVYTSGESQPSPVAEGYPYAAAIDMATTLELDLARVAAADTTLAIRNTGSGDLRLGFYLADTDTEWEHVLPTYPLDGQAGPDFLTLYEDPAEGVSPDLANLQVLGINGRLRLRIGLHGPLPNPEQDVYFQVYLDTDQDRSTGYPAMNAGAEYLLLVGAPIFEYSGGGSLALLVDENMQVIGPPANLVLREGLDSLEIAVQLSHIGSPQAVGINVQMYTAGGLQSAAPGTTIRSTDPVLRLLHPVPDSKTPPAGSHGDAPRRAREWIRADALPDACSIDWLILDMATGAATPAAPFSLPLGFELGGLLEGQHRARLFVRSNDRERPLVTVDVRLALSESLRPQLSYWSTSSQEDGLLLEWAPADGERYQGFYLRRWTGSLEDEAEAVTLGGGLLSAPADSSYRYLDRSVTSGRAAYYRLLGLTAGGQEEPIDPPAYRLYAPQTPSRLILQAPWPNPFRTEASLRIHAPRAGWDLQIMDVTGRIVRRLVESGRGAAGVQVVRWDGRLDSGSPAPQGVYYAVVRGGGRQISRPLVMIR